MRIALILAAAAALLSSSPVLAQSAKGDDCVATFDGYPSVPPCPDGQSRSAQCSDAAKDDYLDLVMGDSIAGKYEEACEHQKDADAHQAIIDDLLIEEANWEVACNNGSTVACNALARVRGEIDDEEGYRDIDQNLANYDKGLADAALFSAKLQYMQDMADCCGSAPAAMLVALPAQKTMDDACNASFDGYPPVGLCPDNTAPSTTCVANAKSTYRSTVMGQVAGRFEEACELQKQKEALFPAWDQAFDEWEAAEQALFDAQTACDEGDMNACNQLAQLRDDELSARATFNILNDQMSSLEAQRVAAIAQGTTELQAAKDAFAQDIADCCSGHNAPMFVGSFHPNLISR